MRMGMYKRVLSIVLLLAILGAIATLIFIIARPSPGEKFTEFYVLGLNGKAEGYPKELTVGEEGRLVLGIVNRELQAMSYRVEWRIGNEVLGEVEPILLDQGGKWEKEIAFTPLESGNHQKFEFWLYKTYELGRQGAKDTLLSLWIGQEESNAIVTNQGEAEASYSFQVKIQEPQANQNATDSRTPVITLQSAGPIRLVPGEQWTQALAYAPDEGNARQIEFSLYRDGELVYEDKTLSSYPALHLWIDVAENTGTH
jgi:uncharacterized membrane protein